jgi:hypothetical protein
MLRLRRSATSIGGFIPFLMLETMFPPQTQMYSNEISAAFFPSGTIQRSGYPAGSKIKV